MKFLIFVLLCGYAFAQEDSISSENAMESSKPDLTFVVDIADSVLLEIKKQNIVKFFQNLNSDTENSFQNYILVSFNTTDVHNAETSSDFNSFNSTLQKLNARPYRKGSQPICKGNSLAGIRKGLELSSSNSFIIVFTDAPPSNVALLPDILSSIAVNHPRVIFILINNNYCTYESQEYKKIAHASNGHIFEVKTTNILKIVEKIQSSIKPGRVDLLAIDDESKAAGNRDFHIAVDDTLSEILIEISTNKIDFTLNITDPANKELNNDKKSQICSKVDNKQTLCSIQKPEIGTYKITLKNIYSYSLRVSATSNISFNNYGFETEANQNVFAQPIKDVNNTFILKLDPKSEIGPLKNVNVISVDGKLNKSFILSPAVNADSGVYYGSFKPIDSYFHLQINGYTPDGTEFQRITPVALKVFSGNSDEKNLIANGIEYVSKDGLVTTPSQDEDSTQSDSSEITPSPTVLREPDTETPDNVTEFETSTTNTSPHPNSAFSHSSSFFMSTFTFLFLMLTVICY